MGRFIRNTVVAAVLFLIFAAAKWITIRSPWDPFGDSVMNQFASAALIGIVHTFGVTVFLLLLMVTIVPFFVVMKQAGSLSGTILGCIGYIALYLFLAGPAGFVAVNTFLKGWVTVNTGLGHMMLMVIILGIFRDNRDTADSSKKQVRYTSRGGGEVVVSGILVPVANAFTALVNWWRTQQKRKRKEKINFFIDTNAEFAQPFTLSDSAEKPKRRIMLGDDGELIEVVDQ